MARRYSRFHIALLLCLLAACLARPLAAQLSTPPSITGGELLVGLSEEGFSFLSRAMIGRVGSEVHRLSRLGVSCLRLRPDVPIDEAIPYLKRVPGVRFVERNVAVQALATPNDSSYASEQWGPQQIQADVAWDLWRPKQSVVLAIVDSGIDLAHPDLTDKIYRVNGSVVGYNALNGQEGAAFDDYAHGTHCAGIAAARVNNRMGIAGVAAWDGDPNGSDADFVKLMSVKVLSNTGSGTAGSLADGIVWAADHGARVLSMSLGTPSLTQTVESAVSYALDKGCVLVAAAGNDGTSQPFYPAGHSGVLSVAATERDDRLTSFSTWGDWVQIAAPGRLIFSTLPTYAVSGTPTRNYGYASGTSMACPHVAGAAAMLIAHEPRLNRFQVADILTKNVDPYGADGGQRLASGAGRLNIGRAMRYLAGATPQPSPGSSPVALLELSVKPDAVGGGSTAAGEVRLNRAAPPGGVTVALSSDQAAAIVPANIVVPAGSATASFNVQTRAVTETVMARITASYGDVTKSATLHVTPDKSSIYSVYVRPATVFGSGSVELTVVLVKRAPGGGAEIALSSSNPDLVPVPATMMVPAGKDNASVMLTTGAATSRTSVAITATRLGASRTTTVELRP